LYEGFGLPVIEGFCAGKPVITSDISPMNDIAGDAAFLVDPHSVSSI
jgi:glycosyltransferase involved in cell wall biosynthesis